MRSAVPATFDQSFRPLLEELARFETTRALESSLLYRKVKSEIDRLLSHTWYEEFEVSAPAASNSIRAVGWNIERGICLEGVIRVLQEHPSMSEADVLFLSELDWGMARTGNRFIAREIASSLRMNYAFAPCYLALTKGAGIEKQAGGENGESLHGNALMSRFPMHGAHSIALPNGRDKMKGAEKRIGAQRAVIADIEHPSGFFRAVSLHLDAHSSQRHRYIQMRRLLDHLESLQPKLPVLIGGDWNTTTHDASRALYSILGYFRRVLMGVRHVVADHYPYPDRWFERRLFHELERRGYSYRDLNTEGECTLHYNVSDIAANLNLGEWVPQWCFWFINWALKRTGGSCSMKLDWFAGKEIRPLMPATAVSGLKEGGKPVSDHDPIVVEVALNSL
ncbi:MAG TPA: endonuclease/exonuclease/phosphatase family protein [Terriglobia bacterium]|nr:endonuclease/exonuclease/phosphatase family protein [Terriglobia bacterium]